MVIPNKMRPIGKRLGSKVSPPASYTPLSALRSTGAQLIVLPIKPSQDYDLTIKFKYVTLSNYQSPYASALSQAYPHRHFNALLNTAYTGALSKNARANDANGGIPLLKSNVNYEFTLTRGENYGVLNGVQQKLTPSSDGVYSDECSDFSIFAGFDGEISAFAVRVGGVSVDLEPYLDAEGEPCMFDYASGLTYYNQGSGSFTPIL